MNEISLQVRVTVGRFDLLHPDTESTMANIAVIQNGKTVETIIDGSVRPMRVGLSFSDDDFSEIHDLLTVTDPDELFGNVKSVFEQYRKRTLWSSALDMMPHIEHFVTENYDDFYVTHQSIEYRRLKNENLKMAEQMERNVKTMDYIGGVVFDHYGPAAAKFVTEGEHE